MDYWEVLGRGTAKRRSDIEYGRESGGFKCRRRFIATERRQNQGRLRGPEPRNGFVVERVTLLQQQWSGQVHVSVVVSRTRILAVMRRDILDVHRHGTLAAVQAKMQVASVMRPAKSASASSHTNTNDRERRDMHAVCRNDIFVTTRPGVKET